MKNPFKYGTIVDNEFFTNRQQELQEIVRTMNSENHLVLISPRRFGKSSLVMKAMKQTGRPFLTVNLQQVISTQDLATKLLKETFKLYKWEHLKHLMRSFRIVPTISTNPMTDSIDVAFQPMTDSRVLLEDVLSLLSRVSTQERRLIVALDEFQEVTTLEKGLDKQLRAIMQLQQNLNYIFLGSQESMMEEIFERKKSPFYHFGKLMRLAKIPYSEFHDYIIQRLPSQREDVTADILQFTSCHPYYTQQLASQVWELMTYEHMEDNIVESAITRLTQAHDLDFERLWINFNRTDKRIMQTLSRGQSPLQSATLPTSTLFSSIKRLMKTGYVIRTDAYAIEDPFFKRWIQLNS
jgi:hypothetical protein